MSLASILSIARTALSAHQLRSQVAAHNIANAATEGYSAQRPVITTAPSYADATGVFGTGVLVVDVGRNRDAFLDATYRDESAGATASGTRRDILQRIESVLGEPSDAGLAASLDAFWSGWDDLGNNPTSASARSVLAERGTQLAAEFNRRADGIATVRADTLTRLDSAVDRLNQLSTQVADLNHRIVALESGNRTAGDLRDQRDQAIDEMAGLAPVQVIEHDDGSVAVNIDGNLAVDGAQALTFKPGTVGTTNVILTDRGTVVRQLGGSIGGMLDILNDQLPDTASRLDALAAGIVAAVNTAHAAGMNRAGQTGQPFFDVTGTAAGTIAVDPAILGDPSRIAAGTPGTDAGGNPVYAAGRMDVARSIATLRDAANFTPPGGGAAFTFGEYYSGLVTDIGADVAGARDSADVHGALSDQALSRREAVSGVSTDEELTHLIEAQSAYAAAARIVTTVEDMIQTVLDMKR